MTQVTYGAETHPGNNSLHLNGNILKLTFPVFDKSSFLNTLKMV